MITTLGMLVLGTVCLPLAQPRGIVADTVSRETLYRQGTTFETFLDQVVGRREMWLRNYERGTVPEDLMHRARAVPGRWHLLVVTVDRCSDSANIVPYVAHLVDAVEALEMRLIDPDLGRGIMEAHRTPDGRAATPTIVLLNTAFQEVGCFIERPSGLQAWALEHRQDLDDAEFLKQKFAWYDNEQGRQTLSEIIDLMEAATSGRIGC
jgi:hypothetical protein